MDCCSFATLPIPHMADKNYLLHEKGYTAGKNYSARGKNYS